MKSESGKVNRQMGKGSGIEAQPGENGRRKGLIMIIFCGKVKVESKSEKEDCRMGKSGTEAQPGENGWQKGLIKIMCCGKVREKVESKSEK